MWLGSFVLASYCVVIGAFTSAGLYLLHHKYFSSMQDNMVRYHNLSVEALHSGNKEAYLAANKLAQEDFGKSFFAQATIGFASLWPLPFALSWMSARFEGIAIYRLPWTDMHAGYVFILITVYIAVRVFFSRFTKKLPPFSHVEAIKLRGKERRGEFRSFFNAPIPDETKNPTIHSDCRETVKSQADKQV